MIAHVSHQPLQINGEVNGRVNGRGPADITLALHVARDLHLPIPKPRAPEVVPAPAAQPQLMGLRTPAVRTHRRKVALHRLSTVRGLSVTR